MDNKVVKAHECVIKEVVNEDLKEDLKIVHMESLRKAQKVGEIFKSQLLNTQISKKELDEIYEESIKYNPELADAYHEMQRRNVQIETGDLNMALMYRDFKRYGMTPERYEKFKKSLKSNGHRRRNSISNAMDPIEIVVEKDDESSSSFHDEPVMKEVDSSELSSDLSCASEREFNLKLERLKYKKSYKGRMQMCCKSKCF